MTPLLRRSAFYAVFAACLAVLIGTYAVASQWNAISPAEPYEVISTPPISKSEGTWTGNLACLPHRDTSGPVTMECAYGLHTSEGYYGLDMSMVNGVEIYSIPFEQTVTVTGMLQSSPPYHEKYDVVGNILVYTIE